MGKVIPLRRRQRQSSRIAICQPAALVHSNGTVATGMLMDISSGGVRVQCDRYTLDSLYLSGFGSQVRDTVRIDVHFKLPLTSGMVKVDAETQLIYVLEEHRTRYLLGLEFVRFHYAGSGIVERFINEANAIDMA